MRALVRECRDELLGAGDMVGRERARLVTEAYRRHEADPGKAAFRRAEHTAAVHSAR
jgi:hypothetical protein